MASVTLEDAWFHLASDLATSTTAALTGASESAARPVEVRRYANGRLRQVTRPGVQQTLTVGLELVSRTTIDLLRSWIGLLIVYRDPLGRLVYGVFGDLSVEEVSGADGTYANAALTIQQVSDSAEV